MDKIRVLAIDDNDGLLGVMKEYFLTSESVEIIDTACDGAEGIDKIEKYQNDVDLILLDIIMPKKDGICVLEAMKSRKINKKVIIETSYDTSDMIKRVADLGACYFITKPYDMTDLEKRIIQIMNENTSRQSSVEYDLHDNQKEVTISKWLHELGIPSHIKGYQYIRESVFLVMENPDMIGAITKTLYPLLAKKFNTTTSRVERAMRHAIEVGWSRSNWKLTEDIFGQSVDFDRTKPTNSEFIVTLADKLRLDCCKTN